MLRRRGSNYNFIHALDIAFTHYAITRLLDRS